VKAKFFNPGYPRSGTVKRVCYGYDSKAGERRRQKRQQRNELTGGRAVTRRRHVINHPLLNHTVLNHSLLQLVTGHWSLVTGLIGKVSRYFIYKKGKAIAGIARYPAKVP